MSLLEIFKQAKLQSTWKYETSGVLWRLLPTENHLFVGEDRNLETKRVTFFCLDAVSGKVLWNNLSFTETWWISIESVHNNVLYLHEFATPDMPDHKKIYAVNLTTAEILWVNDELQFHFAHDRFVYGSKLGFETRHYFRLDASNGKLVEEINASEFQQVQSTSSEATEHKIIFPKDVDESVAKQKNFLKIASKNLKTSQVIECIGLNERLVLSYYDEVRESGNGNVSLEQNVLVADREGRLLYRDKVNEQVKIPVPDSVMMMNGFVYYIKNKKNLIAVKLYE